MNTLLRTLTFWDHASIAYVPGMPESLCVFWSHSLNRDKFGDKGIDTTALDRLVAAGYLEFRDGFGLSLAPRGLTIVLAYRPNHLCQPALYPNYPNWHANTVCFQRYTQLESN